MLNRAIERLSFALSYIDPRAYRKSTEKNEKKETEKKNEKKETEFTSTSAQVMSRGLSEDIPDPNKDKANDPNKANDTSSQDQTSDTTNSTPSSLDGLLEHIQTLANSCQKENEEWQNIKIKVDSIDNAITAKHKPDHDGFFKWLRTYFQKGESNLQELKDKLDAHLSPVKTQLNVNIEKFKDLVKNKDADPVEAQRIADQMCAEAIHVLQEHILFFTKMQQEIVYCKDSTEVSLKLAIEAFKFIFQYLVHIALPDLNLGLNEFYERNLLARVLPIANQSDISNIDVQSEIQIAKQSIISWLPTVKRTEEKSEIKKVEIESMILNTESPKLSPKDLQKKRDDWFTKKEEEKKRQIKETNNPNSPISLHRKVYVKQQETLDTTETYNARKSM